MLDLPYDFDSLMAAGSMSGSGAIIVMDDSADIVEALANISRILRARELRPMHALPRRLAVDEQGAASPDAWSRAQAGRGLSAPDCGQYSGRAHDLRFRRSVLVAGAKFCRKFKDEFVAKGAADEARRKPTNLSGAGPTAEMKIAASPHA